MQELEQALNNYIAQIEKVDLESMKMCRQLTDTRFIPFQSLGYLEDLAVQIAGITGKPTNSIQNPCHFVASADNGVIEENISSSPPFFTKLVSETMLDKICTIGLFCRLHEVELNVIDIGIKNDLAEKFNTYSNFYNKKIAYGTKNFAEEAAMTKEETLHAIITGIELIKEKKDADFFSNGEMGIGNTCTSAAVLYALTEANLDDVVGRGGGLSDEGLERKKAVVLDAFNKYQLKDKSPLVILQHVGGLDLACLVGLYLGAAIERKPMIIDGFISATAALVAYRLEPKIKDYLIASHCSEEPGMKIILQEIGIKTFLDLNMRLGEGTGAVLAYPIIKTALEVPKQIKTMKEVYALYDIEA